MLDEEDDYFIMDDEESEDEYYSRMSEEAWGTSVVGDWKDLV